MRYKKHIFVCTNLRPPEHPKGSCGQKNSETLRNKFKKRIAELGLGDIVRVNSAGCLDACEHGISIVIYPEGIWYGRVKEEDIDKIINEHLLKGKVVEELLIKDERFKPEIMLNLEIQPLKNERKQLLD